MERPELLSMLAMHRAVFFNDVHLLSKLIRETKDTSTRDMHGNTPLHLAIMLGHKESVVLLLAHNAPVKTKNSQGWDCLTEAISYGDRQIARSRSSVTSVLRKLKRQQKETITSRKSNLLAVLEEMGDFYAEVKWEFNSWIPLVSSVLPSDVCKVYKKGTSLRLDTTLVDFNEKTWERGDVTFIYHANALKPSQREIQAQMLLDNKAKVYQRVRYDMNEMDLENEVDVLMASDVVNAHMSTKPIHFERALTGWFFKHERNETVGNFVAAKFYAVEGMELITKKRREHLSVEEVKKNKAALQNPQRGHCINKCEDFPLEFGALLDIMEVVAPFRHLDKLRRFCLCRLPSGFPVRLEVPILPTISVKLSFEKVDVETQLDDKLFRVPGTYREDSNRLRSSGAGELLESGRFRDISKSAKLLL